MNKLPFLCRSISGLVVEEPVPDDDDSDNMVSWRAVRGEGDWLAGEGSNPSDAAMRGMSRARGRRALGCAG